LCNTFFNGNIIFVKKITKNLQETHDAARDFAASLSMAVDKEGESDGAIVVALSGDLGSGKTSFVQGVAKYFGIKDKIVSPTFVIQKRYELKGHKNLKNLVHIDAYRLLKPEEITRIGWNNLIKEKGNIVFVEWPEKIEPLLPKGHKKLVFEFIDPEKRGIEGV